MGHDKKNGASAPIDWVATQTKGEYVIKNEDLEKADRFSFWKDAPLFQSTIDTDMFVDPINKFVIQSIKELGNGRKALVGHKQVAIVSGTFSDTNFAIGQKIDVFPCLCCLQKEVIKGSIYKKNDKKHKTDKLQDQGEKLAFDSQSSNSDEDRLCCDIVYDDVLFDGKVIFHINDRNNSLLIEDDVLTVTAFCKALECINNPILKELVADFSFEFAHPSLAIGIIIHEVIQSSLMTKNASFSFLSSEAKRIIKDNLLNLYCCNINDREALNEVLKHMKNIVVFLSKNFTVESVEHRVYSSCYGLKGSIDCVDRNYVLEIKTGKNHSLVHRSQAILYTLLLLEQRLKKRCKDYNQFLFDVSGFLGTSEDPFASDFNKANRSARKSFLQLSDVTNSDLQAEEKGHVVKKYEVNDNRQSENKAGKNCHTSAFDDSMNDAELAIKPLLYYVKSGDFVNIELKHEEISYLLKIRNDIACNKGISVCGCPENYPCSILNKIKLLPDGHFLKKQYLGVELEASRPKSMYKGVLLNQSKNKVVIKLVEDANTSDYCYFYSLNEKYISFGLIESFEKRVITVNMNEEIKMERMVLVSFENDSNFLKFMRWSLINIAYMKYVKKDYFGPGIDSFALPGQSYGLESPDTENEDGYCENLNSSVSFNSIELQEIFLNSTEMASDDLAAMLVSDDKDIKIKDYVKPDINADHQSSDLVVDVRQKGENLNIDVSNRYGRSKPNVAESAIPSQTSDNRKSKNVKHKSDFESSSTNLESFSISQLSSQDLVADGSKLIDQIFSDDDFCGSLEIKRGISDIFDSSDENTSNKLSVERNSKGYEKEEKYSCFSSLNVRDQRIVNSSVSNSRNQSSDQIIFDLASVSTDQDTAKVHSQINLSFLAEKPNQAAISQDERSKVTRPAILFNENSNPSFDYFTPVNNSLSSVEYRYAIPDIFKDEFLKLNEDQKAALFAALNCDNYKIIHGMPGTGKSTVIALLIRILIYYKQKVLFISYTHLAIQNVLNRVGSIRYYRAKKDETRFNSVEEISRYYNQIDLVAGTCYSFTDPIYINRKFDYCIIDEGSQIHLLLALIPISLAKRFCMVGDHLQLKPLCKKSVVLSLSLFEYLSDKCSTLTFQYRMGDQIMHLSNVLFYNNRLQGFGGQSSVHFLDIKTINFQEYISSLQNITVLCYFNHKVKEVQQINKNISVTTIDKYQGSESDDVLVIFDPIDKCEILESGERLNVALTRARKRLFLLGDRQEMAKIPILRKLLEIL